MSVSSQNVQPSFDPTAYTSLSGAQLKQLIDGILMYADKGLLISTADVAGVPQPPDADSVTGTPSWQRCIWMRVGATTVTPYIWIETAAVHAEGINTLNKWYTIAESTIGPGTIGTAQLADNSVTNAKIVSLDASKLTGTLSAAILATLMSTGTAAGGDLTGTYPNPTVGLLAITTAKLADANVTAAKLASDSVITAKILDANVTTAKIADTNVTLAKASTTFVNEATAKASPLSADKVMIADTAAANINKNTTIGAITGVRQLVAAQSVTVYSHAGTAQAIGAVLEWGTGTEIANIALAITPKDAASTLLVEATVQVATDAGSSLAVGMWRDPSVAGDDAAAAAIFSASDVNGVGTVHIQFKVAAGSAAATAFKFRVARIGAGTAYVNRTNGAATLLNAAQVFSASKVTEYVV